MMIKLNKILSFLLVFTIIIFLLVGCGVVADTDGSIESTINATEEVTESVVAMQDDVIIDDESVYENCAPGHSPQNVIGEQYERLWKSDDGCIEFICNNSRSIYGYGVYTGKYHNNGETYNIEVDITGGFDGYLSVYIPVMLDSTTLSYRPIMVGYYVYENNTVIVTTKEPDIDGLPPVYDEVSKYTFGETVTFHRE